MNVTSERLHDLVDWESGKISPEIFVDEDIYRMELEKVFGRTWLFLAHESMIPEPGDFHSTYMGSDPVMIVRQRDMSVKAFLNVCRHRGMMVCRAEDGNAKAFACTYHGWTYNTAGELVDAPLTTEAYRDNLDKSSLGLVPVAQLQSYKGLWFGNFDASAPPLVEYLGHAVHYIDTWLDHADGGIEVLPGAVKWTINGNWKLGAEQFAGDGYHAVVTHASFMQMIAPDIDYGALEGGQFSSRQGHGCGFQINSDGRLADDPVSLYKQDRQVQALERLGEPWGRMQHHWTVYPSFSGLAGNANIRVWHPKGPNKFEIWSYTVVDKNAPPEVKAAQQRSATFTEGAAGVIEVDDGENWDLIGRILEQGHQARKIDWDYSMGAGTEVDEHEVYPGRITEATFGEGPQRAFYRRWLEFMTHDEWPVVDEFPHPKFPLVASAAHVPDPAPILDPQEV